MVAQAHRTHKAHLGGLSAKLAHAGCKSQPPPPISKPKEEIMKDKLSDATLYAFKCAFQFFFGWEITKVIMRRPKKGVA
jgi:hypothetical protein